MKRDVWPLLLVIACVVVFFWFVAWSCHRQEDCEARGGIWLHREMKCVPGFERTPPGER